MLRPTSIALLLIALCASAPAYAQAIPDPAHPDPNGKRPVDLHDEVWLENLTWMEVRDHMAAGKRTVIIPTGGIEQNGPYLVLNKHNIVLRVTMEALARKLGNALVAPVVPFVPEGDFDPPTLHMLYPGSITVTEGTYRALLTDIARSMKVHGFEHIVLVGDSGGNQPGMKLVAEALSKEWAGSKTDIIHVPEYYDNRRVDKWIADQGIKEVQDGYHDDVHYTASMMVIDPESVRASDRKRAGLFHINGVDLSNVAKMQDLGRRMAQFQAEYTAEAIYRRLAAARAKSED